MTRRRPGDKGRDEVRTRSVFGIGCLLAENSVQRNQLERRILLFDHERRTLAEKTIVLVLAKGCAMRTNV